MLDFCDGLYFRLGSELLFTRIRVTVYNSFSSYDLHCLYSCPRVIPTLTMGKRGLGLRGHFVTLIQVRIHLTECKPGVNLIKLLQV